MRKIWDFHGGIHPVENKAQSTAASIRQLPLPPRLRLPLQQHIGALPRLSVAVGDSVLKGQLLAEADGRVSVSLHAPTSGTVTAIGDYPTGHVSALDGPCIEITPDGDDRWTTLTPCENYEALSIAEIQQRIRAAGIAGMGGAGFPTEVKLHPPTQDKVDTLILNGAECEPYITADDLLMRERAIEVIGGLEIMAYVLQPTTCLIGIEDNKPEAIEALTQAAQGTRIEVVVIPTKYPSGGEKQLIRVLTGLEVPHGSIPADIGVMCQNVATAAAVYRAIRFGEPLISRITTLTGQALAQPGNVDVRLGSSVDWLLRQAGVNEQQLNRLILGGPMMGHTLTHTDVPVTKTTNCLIAATADELPAPPPAQACIRCAQCADACPMDLLPQQLYWFARSQEHEKAERHHLFDCIECGACSYVCPSTIPLVQYYRFAKGEIRQKQQEKTNADRARERFESRKERMERELLEKEEKRRARADEAARQQAARREAEALAEASPAPEPVPASVNAWQPGDPGYRSGDPISGDPTCTNAPDEVPVERPDLATLEKALEQARQKLALMENTLAEAQANKPEQVEKLMRAVEKNQERVTRAEEALQAGRMLLAKLDAELTS